MVAGTARKSLLPATLILGLLLCGVSCGRSGRDRPAEVTGPAPGHLVTHLDDDRRTLPDGRVAWRTWWSLCWDPYPAARSYEVQAVTGEGASPKVRGQADACLRVEAAAGEDPPDSLAAHRSTLLALQEGQLAYRVRAVLDGNRRSEWSAAQAVGGST